MSLSSARAPQRAMPSGSGALFFIQMFATLGFAVLYSTLVLYVTKRLGFSEAQANTMMGIFGAFNYGLHLFGGCLGGRYLSNRNLFILGMVLQVIGCYLIAELGITGLWWGLAMFLSGSGLNVTCLNMMLTQRFTPDDDRREAAFLWNYAGMNLGFFIGFTVAGYYQLTENYRSLFLFATFGNIAAVVITLLRWPILSDINTPLQHIKGARFYLRMAFGLAVLILLVPVLRVLLSHTGFSSSFVVALGALVFVMLCVMTARHRHHDERRRMLAYLMLASGSLVFWSLYQLAPMGLTLFAEHNVTLNAFGWKISPQWLQNINTLVIVVGGPLMALLFKRLRDRGVQLDIPVQFSASLFCMGAGMLMLPLGISMAGADGMVALKWVVISYILQSLGELLISPVGYSMIGKLAPSHLQGLMMGCWMMVTGVASVLAGYVSGLMPQNSGSTAAATNPGYNAIFNALGWGAAATGVVLLLLIPLLRRLITSHKVTVAQA
ncbi:peptide MFS transporter [Shimwellia pseudoproteus]|uniref:peptide MFS transporter n=1 Tax=Shimwellia pseudoproteus TaxID=570012 RepID=UPI0018EAB915|nr:oligopeptide:H+ symporter [Shimwellia pseudoproteus]MBJ3816640.1 peptide MFS transporter [Shimwellia pseudoproteus]